MPWCQVLLTTSPCSGDDSLRTRQGALEALGA
jgi:hypothetical protein